MLAASFACACLFALVHMSMHRLHVLDTIPRSRWLSFAGGVAVAYVFLHILPELSAYRESLSDGLAVAEDDILYAVVLAGLAAFYGLERLIKAAPAECPHEVPEGGAYVLHLGSFAMYNVLVGYLVVHREEGGCLSLALYALAMTLHFVTMDFGLRQVHRHRYDRNGRWILAGSVATGWALGAVTQVSDTAVALLFALLAGAIVINALKEELPEERQSRFAPFLFGAGFYGGLLLVL